MADEIEIREERDPREVLASRVRDLAERIEDEGKERVAAARRLKALSNPRLLDDPEKLGKELEKTRRAIAPELGEALGVSPVLEEVEEHLKGAEERIRQRLGRELMAACQAADIPFVVVSREEPVEVRLAPLLLRIRFDRGRAELLFAREVVATAPPEAQAILGAREKALKALETAFDPEKFFDECLAAWRAALAATGRTEGDRVEILDFLPYCALGRQSRKFRSSPAKETFRPYGKARLAYDVLRLRRAGALSRNGLRLNFGVATGTSASQKDRVLYLEDEHGDGEYKLTVFFTPTEGR